MREGGAEQVRDQMKLWLGRAEVDYERLYVSLYTAYNAWYIPVTGATSDTQALLRLTKRYGIWSEYLEGTVLQGLRPIVEKISLLTRVRPLVYGRREPIVLESGNDWTSLIYYWYRIRCILVHGAPIESVGVTPLHIRLAYDSLRLFLEEIMRRIDGCFYETDRKRLDELTRLAETSEGLTGEQIHELDELYDRYVQAPQFFEVDMPCSPRITPFTHLEKGVIIVPIRRGAMLSHAKNN